MTHQPHSSPAVAVRGPTPAHEALEHDDPPPYVRVPETPGAPREDSEGVNDGGLAGGQPAKNETQSRSCFSKTKCRSNIFNESGQFECITDPEPWTRQSFAAHLKLQPSIPGGQLAAHFDSCESPICTESSILLYQDTTNKLVVLGNKHNQPGAWTRDRVFLRQMTSQISDLAAGAALSFSNFSPFLLGGDNPTPRTDLRLFVEMPDPHQLAEYVWDRSMEKRWQKGGTLLNTTDLDTAPGSAYKSPSVASYSWDFVPTVSSAPEDVAVAILYPSGTISTSRFAGPGSWITEEGAVLNSVGKNEIKNASAVTFDGLRFYTIEGGLTLKYTPSGGNNPFTWTEVRSVSSDVGRV
ncbi:hypothetical protein B0T22DRAFT_480959 [Podospora appendiculata]|uniref:Uncharacterized protein n=1 Tax=Podospora appendiculata TaxID=314037 RepID=A0AAE0XBS6_9PEZI|nr:hypothetical protein B0T22DRAFT_480959 [Podospora appendiculata]